MPFHLLNDNPHGNKSWNIAFGFNTNEPKPPTRATLDYDEIVNLLEFAICASGWLISN
jgi:hypothetical protein